MTTHRHQFGTVRTLPSGKHQARYTDQTGKRVTAGAFGTAKAARAALAAIQTDLARGILREREPSTITFSEFVDQWREVTADRVQPTTMQGYETLLRLWLMPTFGDRPLSKIAVRDVDTWWASTGKRTGPVNRRNAYMVFSNVMRLAARYDLLPKGSPCMVENASADVAKPRPFLTVDDFKRILELMPAHFHAPLWVTFGAHLRLGELCGLNMGDVDLAEGSLYVGRQARQVRGVGLELSQTKTGTIRTVTLPAPVLDLLRDYLSRSRGLPSAPLFTGPLGGRLQRGTIRKAWNAAREAAGLPHAHLHDLRATSLTMVAQEGGTLAEVMKRGGHTSVTAAARYQHATPERDRQLADALSAAIA